MNKIVKYGMIKIALIALVFGLLRVTPIWNSILSAGEFRKVDFSSLVLTPKPNQFLVCPDGFCPSAKAHLTSPEYAISATKLAEVFHQIIDQQGGVKKIATFGGNLDLVVRTPLMGWPDWVTIQFISIEPEKSSIAIYSRSVFGHSDFGANEKRITLWLDILRQKINS